MNKPVVILGSGGHASVLLDMLFQEGREVLAYVSPIEAGRSDIFGSLRWISSDADMTIAYDDIEIVNGLGSLPGTEVRQSLYKQYKRRGYTFASVVSGSAITSEKITLSEGVQIFPGCIVNSGVKIGRNSILNSGSIIEHDCIIGDFNHIAPSAVLCGDVTTQENVHIGAGATIIQGITINKNTVVGAGACVTTDPQGSCVIFPAKTFCKKLGGSK